MSSVEHSWLEAASRLAGEALLHPRRLGGGRNSAVFRVETQSGRPLAVKRYVREAGDARDRMGQEFRAFQFLWAAGERAIPEPLASDSEQQLALYGFVEGDSVGEPGLADLDTALDFLARLGGYAGLPEAVGLPRASEACFSIEELRESLANRMKRLQQEGEGDGLRGFLLDELGPALERHWGGIPRREDALPLGERILSPSDFGFHNAIRQPDGGLVFLDFEYFGWDDPAKTLCDFLLHPGMGLAVAFRRAFKAGFLTRFAHLKDLETRTEALFPLYGIKWCLILLNEFLPGPLSRRRLAQGTVLAKNEIQSHQLGKARQLLQSLEERHGTYWPR